jgi:hypothetical protein
MWICNISGIFYFTLHVAWTFLFSIVENAHETTANKCQILCHPQDTFSLFCQINTSIYCGFGEPHLRGFPQHFMWKNVLLSKQGFQLLNTPLQFPFTDDDWLEKLQKAK